MEHDDILHTLQTIIVDSLRHCHFKVHAVYNVRNNPKWKVRKRTIPDWMLVYIRDGEGAYLIGESTHEMKPGKLYLLSDDLVHQANHKKDHPVSKISIRFGLYSNQSNEMLARKYAPFGLAWNTSKPALFHSMFTDVYEYFKFYSSTLRQSLCNTRIARIFHALYLEMDDVKGKNRVDPRLLQAQLFIENNPLESLTLEAVAKHVKLSPKYFSHLFASQLGISFKEYLYTTKMNYAKLLLEETTYSIKEISNLLNYADQYTFSTQFKKVIGLSPSVFRKRKC